MKESFPEGKSDLFAGFVIRCLRLLAHDGLVGFMTPFVWMFIKSYETLRKSIIKHKRIVSLIQLEYSGFEGATVPICTYVLQNGHSEVAGSFVRLSDFVGPAVQGPTALRIIEDDKATRRGASTSGMDEHLFRVSSSSFTAIPGSPIVYWLSEKMRATFKEGQPLSEVANLRQGLATGNNKRFVRLWWEVSRSRTTFDCESCADATGGSSRWFPYNKGGEFRKWYGNQEYVLAFSQSDYELLKVSGNKLPSRDRYFSPSVSWSDISSGEAAFRRFPSGFIYANTGHSAFADTKTLGQVALLMNSTFSTQVLRILAPTLHFDIGYVSQVPVTNGIERLPIESLDELVTTSKRDWDEFETSWEFASSPLVTISQELHSSLH